MAKVAAALAAQEAPAASMADRVAASPAAQEVPAASMADRVAAALAAEEVPAASRAEREAAEAEAAEKAEAARPRQVSGASKTGSGRSGGDAENGASSLPDEAKDTIKGIWKTTDGLTCIVVGDECAFVGKTGAARVRSQGGQLSLNGWVSTAFGAESVKWQKAIYYILYNAYYQSHLVLCQIASNYNNIK